MAPVFDTRAFPSAGDIHDRELADLAAILQGTGFTLGDYKSSCVKRRVAIRIRATRCRSVEEYRRVLLEREGEAELLRRTLTIHVSQFFRNPSLFEALRLTVLPELYAMAAERPEGTLRICCLGCAEGEEPYSLALLLREHFAHRLERIGTQIRGMDIDAATLAAAERAEYGGERLKEVPPSLLRRYFTQQGERYRLKDEVREMVSYSQANIGALDHSAAGDLMFCRNTLMYFARPEQERVLTRIAEILPPHGILVLGRSETLVGATRRYFAPLSPGERIYRKSP